MSRELVQSEKKRKEQLARLTAPLHITQNHFTEHKSVEGYQEDRRAEGFFGCDRLMKMDSMYGTIQMGYSPRRKQSFLFANIKTSVFDTAASREHHRMNEQQQMGELKTGNQNRAYVARRRQNSAVLLYKAENKPWSEASVSPYLSRVNTGALRKTLPFLEVQTERRERRQAAEEQKTLQQEERAALQKQNGGGTLQAIRGQRVELSEEQNRLGALIVHKQQKTLWFFRRVNLVFDLQKQKMFEYYRNHAAVRVREAENAALPPPDDINIKNNKGKKP